MSDRQSGQPYIAYIYQPEPIFKKDGTENKVIYGISGPGTEEFFGKRYTREDAEKALAEHQAALKGTE